MIDLHRLHAAPEAALTAARALIADAHAADGASPVSDQALVAVTQGSRELALYAQAPLDDRIVAAGILGEGELDLVVRPDERGRGVGTAALAELLSVADTAAAPTPILAWAHGDNPAADALLTHAGFSPVRSLYRMALDPARLPGDGRDPLAASVPPGFSLHTFEASRDAAAWVRVNAAAFADHPEQGRITESDFALMRDADWFDPSDLFLLVDARGEAVGYTWVKTVRADTGHVETELYALGVDPAHAGLGLGRLLLDVTLARMAAHAPAQVTLYVDGDNTRAVGLYESVGFTIDSRSRQWSRATAASSNARMDA